MPRYQKELIFWEIELEGSYVVVRRGHIDQTVDDATVDTRSYVGPVEARWEYDRAIAHAIADGFVRISDVEVHHAINEELDAQLAGDPDNVDLYLVYSDWLQARADPRGELISVHHAMAEHDARVPRTSKHYSARASELRRAEFALLYQYKEHFFGEDLSGIGDLRRQTYLADSFQLEWFYGFLRSASLPAAERRRAPAEPDTKWRYLLATRSAQFVRSLMLDWLDADVLLERAPATLRQLTFDLGVLPPAYADEYYDPEHLDDTVGPAPRVLSEIMPVLTPNKMPNLRILRFLNSRITDEIASTVMDSDLVGTLEVLDLAHGSLSDRGATSLINNRSAFQNLQELNVRGSRLSAPVSDRLKRSFAHVVL